MQQNIAIGKKNFNLCKEFFIKKTLKFKNIVLL